MAPFTASVEKSPEEDAAGRDKESDDQPHHPGPIDPLRKRGSERERKREQDGKPLPLAGCGIAEADAGDEEEDIRGDPHGRIIPTAREAQSSEGSGAARIRTWDLRFWRPAFWTS
jgi:hypothetical protein